MSLNLCQYWMCEPQAIRTFADTISRMSLDQIRQLDEPVEKQAALPAGAFEKSGTVATIRVSGILLQRIPQWLHKYIQGGYIDATGLDVIRQQVQQAAADPEVTEIHLLIQSPGGTVAGTMDAASAVSDAAKTKKVIAYIDTLAASAAYYIASQASTIVSGGDAEIGSIGVYAVYYDSSGFGEKMGIKAVVISSGPFKGAGVELAPITAEQIAAVREVITDMAAHFVGAVAGGRGMPLKAVKALADGRVWLAPKAQKLGLIDHIQKATLINKIERIHQMENEKEQQQHDSAVASALADGAAQAAARMKSLRETFPQDLQFAMEQFEAGSTVQQAKAAYCDKLAAQNKQLAEDLEAEKAKAAKKQAAGRADGADPIPHTASDGDGQPAAEGSDEFMDHVGQYQKQGLTRGQAFAKAVRNYPDAHEAHLALRTVVVKP